MKRHAKSHGIAFVLIVAMTLAIRCTAAEPAVPLYGVHEVVFVGPAFGPADVPARDVDLVTQWRHESGRPVYTIQGFWDGDGRGGSSGNVFKVRFCPIQTGKWTLVAVTSNKPELNGQNQGYTVTCAASTQPGFWVAQASKFCWTRPRS